MRDILLARFFTALSGVVGMLFLGFWYLYYRRIAPSLTREHVPQATRKYVQSRFVLLSLASTLQYVGLAVYWYVMSLFAGSGHVSQAWSIAGVVGIAAYVPVMVAGLWTGDKLRRALRSVEQPEV